MANVPFHLQQGFAGQFTNPGQVQLHFGRMGKFRQPGSVMPSQQFGQQQGQRSQQQGGQQNDFMAQLRSYMGQMGQQQPQFQQNPAQAGQQQMSQMFGQGGQHPGGVAAGDFLAEAFARDYANQAGARQQMGQTMGGFLEGLRGVPAMGMMGVDMARQAGQEGAGIAREGMEQMMRQAQGAQGVAQQTRKDVQAATGMARGQMQKGIDTMQKAIADQDFFRKDTVASGLQGVQSQFQSAKEQIMSNPNLSDEDKQVQMDNLNNTMRQQAASYASQADSQAAESLLQAKNALSGMQLSMGSTLGGLAMQGAGLSSGAGLQAAGMGLQAAQAGYQLMNAQSQFAGSLAQSAMAQAIQANLSGNAMGAQLAMQMPMGAPNLADTILAMMNAQGMRPGTETTGPFAGRLGGLLGQGNFGGYADRNRESAINRPTTYRVPGSMFG